MFPILYHTHHSKNKEDLPFWLGLAASTPGPVLELGCGTGRVLRRLSRAGHTVYGLDNDLAMLSFLRSHMPKREQANHRLFAADMANFSLAAGFGLIILPCNTLSTLPSASRLQTFECVHRHLRPGGLFAASLPNPHMLLDLEAESEPEVEEILTHPVTGNPLLVSSGWVRTADRFILTWNYDHLLLDGQVERLTAETLHYLDPAEMYQAELAQAGLEQVAVYGEYDQSGFTKESTQLILVYQKSLPD